MVGKRKVFFHLEQLLSLFLQEWNIDIVLFDQYILDHSISVNLEQNIISLV